MGLVSFAQRGMCLRQVSRCGFCWCCLSRPPRLVVRRKISICQISSLEEISRAFSGHCLRLNLASTFLFQTLTSFMSGNRLAIEKNFIPSVCFLSATDWYAGSLRPKKKIGKVSNGFDHLSANRKVNMLRDNRQVTKTSG